MMIYMNQQIHFLTEQNYLAVRVCYKRELFFTNKGLLADKRYCEKFIVVMSC